VDRGEWLKEIRSEVGLVNNSSFLNGDVGITELVILNLGKQIIVSSSLVYLLLYSLVRNYASALYLMVCSID
jgi:hypothetical protein